MGLQSVGEDLNNSAPDALTLEQRVAVLEQQKVIMKLAQLIRESSHGRTILRTT